jgi:GTP-binding protein
MGIPVVAIIGRPNVGKSSLLNALAGERISIVEPTAGVTRDRVSTIINIGENYFELIDTGGYGIVDRDDLSAHIERQIFQAIGSASLVLFVVDIREGLVPLDEKTAQLLRKENLGVILVANKADEARMFSAAGEFGKLGFGEAICVSATNNLNKAVLMEKILERLSQIPITTPKKPVMKIAVVGKRNAGKSTLINSVAGEERVIVSEVPGTTRDSIDVRFEKDGKTFVIIDTAGVRKKSKVADSIEFYSLSRAQWSIRRADVVLFLIDSTVPISQPDKKLASFIATEYKTCILVVNKWDLAKNKAGSDDYAEYLGKLFPWLRYAPIAFTTASESKNVQAVLDLAMELFKQSITRIPTAKLNKAIETIKQERVTGSKKGGKLPKVYYATQLSVLPITLLLFVNDASLFDENYRRFVVGRLRELLPISEVPIRLFTRTHE